MCLLVRKVSFTTSWGIHGSSAFCWNQIVGKLPEGIQLAAGQRSRHFRTGERGRCCLTRSCENVARCDCMRGRALWNS